VILDDASRADLFSSDPYLQAARPKALLCLPILRQSELAGVLYLENNLVAGAFTEDRLTVVGLLASQAAFSLENASLFAALQEALRIRDEFLSIASHELKTPLTPLRLSLQALRGELARVGSFGHWLPRLDLLLRQVDRLATLVDTLLDVARSASAPMATRFVETDLTELAREVLARFAPAAAQARCPTVLHSPGAAVAEVDPPRIETLVANLLANAIRFGAGKPITLSVFPGTASVRLVIEDRGSGISPKDQSRIFDLFERAVDERRYGGLGIGLYVARNIVEVHGGTITCSSAPGAGSQFEVELPTKHPVRPAPPPT
jgi:signal transduction histidine kinase